MKYGILKIGDVVKYTSEAKQRMPTITDDKEYTVTNIDCDDSHADGIKEDGDEWYGADIYWLNRIRKGSTAAHKTKKC